MAILHHFFVYTSKEFIYGFITGLMTLLFTFVIFIRMFLFRTSNASQRTKRAKYSDKQSGVVFLSFENGHLKADPSDSSPNIHQSDSKEASSSAGHTDAVGGIEMERESCEWINFLLKEIILGPILKDYLSCIITNLHHKTTNTVSLDPSHGELEIDAVLHKFTKLTDNIVLAGLIQHQLDQCELPSILGPIKLTNLALGPSIPKVQWIQRIYPPPASSSKPATIITTSDLLKIQLDWYDIGFGSIDTTVQLRWPSGSLVESHPLVELPCQLGIRIDHIKCTVIAGIEKHTQNANSDSDHTEIILSIAALPGDFEIKLAITSTLGHQVKLKNVPKVTQIIAAHIRTAIETAFVWPNTIKIPILHHAGANL